MTRYHWYTDGEVSLGPTDAKELGKKPSLMVQRGQNAPAKVASFKSEADADEFQAVLDRLLVDEDR